jgi:hypothetical protein
MAGCASVGLPKGSPDFRVQLDVTDLKAEERALLEEGVCDIGGVSDCKMEVVQPAPPPKKKGKKRKDAPPPTTNKPPVRITLVYSGDMNDLRRALGKLPHPGLEPKTADATLTFRGFDNLAPQVKVLVPAEGDDKVYSKLPLAVELEVIGEEVAEVSVMGEPAVLTVKGPWRAEISPKDGVHTHEIKAVDKDGNVGTATVTTRVDTTPPELDLSIEKIGDAKAKVSGRVIDGDWAEVDRREVELDGGRFETTVFMDPDKRSVTVRVRDEHGNEAIEVWDLDSGERISRD